MEEGDKMKNPASSAMEPGFSQVKPVINIKTALAFPRKAVPS